MRQDLPDYLTRSPLPGLGDTLASRVARDFFTHSGHVPLTLLILELLLAPSVQGYFIEPDPYLLLLAGIGQAMVFGYAGQRGWRLAFLVNLVGPLLYSLSEAGLEGIRFFTQWHHQAYWSYALAFTLLQGWQAHAGRILAPLVILENLLRATIPLLMYALFEALSGQGRTTLEDFFGDSAHVFLTIVLLLIGVLLGFADLNLRRSLSVIRELAARLREYSEWSLGSGILERAIADSATLNLQRVERAVLFMDLRGFTAWSERQAPETVVGMLNEYYRIAENCLLPFVPIKLKYTADEVMAVFVDAAQAAAAGRALLAALPQISDGGSGLRAGIGLHYGPVVEGVLGGNTVKAYDFIGDTVNTAQRICDAAGAGELLASAATAQAIGAALSGRREIAAKGKSEPLAVCVLARSA
ncbi:MAG: adenylate/guanylate cyclase domain-containing protein [Proteobacteria bacterium]|nr:adenylate/guanylate cyclase domain-containing protein [Pseudomonadota bacterium]